MATPNLGIPVPVESQAKKSQTIADALAALDKATQGATPLTITGATTVTAAEFTGGVSLELTGTPGAPFNLTVPATRRLFRVKNSTDDIATVKTAGAGATVAVPVGEARLLYCDGAGDNIFEEGGGGGGGGDIAIEDEGSEVVAAATRLDFKGAGVTAADDTGGQAGITIPGVTSQEGGTPVVTGTSAVNFAAADFDVTDETAGITGIALADQSLETKANRITTDQTITGSPEQVQWNNEIRDEFAGHDNSTNNERIVIGTNIVDAQGQIALLSVSANSTTICRIVRYNSADALQEVVASAEINNHATDTLISFHALNVRGGAAGDYLVVDLDSTDASVDVDLTGSFFLVRKSSGGGTGSAPVPFTAGSSYCILAGKVESFPASGSKVLVWTEVEDTDGYFGGGTVADEHVVFPFTGRYRITALIQLASASTTTYTWQIAGRLNRGATTTFDRDFTDLGDEGKLDCPSGSIRRMHRISGLVDVTGGDEIDLILNHIGATRDLEASSFWHIEHLGPTPP